MSTHALIVAVGLTATLGTLGTLGRPSGGADAQRLLPVDEAARNPDFLAFRKTLQSAVAQHDVDAVLRVVSPNIKNNFGGDDGIESFKQLWRLDQPGGSELWTELGAVLALGGTFDAPETFVAPYVFSRWPKNLDAFDYAAIVGTNVRVRAAATTQARSLTMLSYEIVRLGRPGRDPDEAWTPVVLDDGRRGFVAARFIRSPVGYRAYFTRSNGAWQMTMFLAGD